MPYGDHSDLHDHTGPNYWDGREHERPTEESQESFRKRQDEYQARRRKAGYPGMPEIESVPYLKSNQGTKHGCNCGRLLDRIAELVEDDTIFGRGLDERLDAMRAIEKLIREAKAGRWPQEKTDGG